MGDKFDKQNYEEFGTPEHNNEKADIQPETEEEKALDGLKDNVLKMQIDKEISELKVNIDKEKQTEIENTRKKVGVLRSEVDTRSVPYAQKNIEEMNELEIENLANIGRQESVANVQNMIQSTKWIPDRLKENA